MNYWKTSSLTISILFTILLPEAMHAQNPSIVQYTGQNEITIQPGKVESLTLSFNIKEGHYIQGNILENEDFIPTVLTLEPLEGIEMGPVVYPPALKYKYIDGDPAVDIFKNQLAVVLPIKVVGNTDTPREFRVAGSLYYQACSLSKCFYPRSLDFSILVKVKENQLASAVKK